MERDDLKKALVQFGKILNALAINTEFPGFQSGLTEAEFMQLKTVVNKEFQYNPWFTKENVNAALAGIAAMLEESELDKVFTAYKQTANPKRIAIIMAGNIPFVGFHDVLAVLVTGNIALCKFSSDDSRIPPTLLKVLIDLNPELQPFIEFSFGPVKNYDAVIATGSNNTINTLKDYFKDKPALFRKNRTSIAVLDGSETKEELEKLSEDCFLYFGMGCRNVGKLLIPSDFNVDRIFEGFLKQSDVINHHKYANNYDYQRTVFLMNQVQFLDNNAFMMKEDKSLHAPLSIIYFQRYGNEKEVQEYIAEHEDEIQAVVGKKYIPFGAAQKPGILDFADGVDTFAWLNDLN